MPAHNGELSAHVFRQSCTAFNPVAIIAVEDAIYVTHLCVMNVTANDTVDAAFAGCSRDCGFETGDVLDRILHFLFQIGRQRPVGQAHEAPCVVQPIIQREGRSVGPVA